MDIKDGIINKLAIRIANLEVEKAEIQTRLENALCDIEELKEQLNVAVTK